MMSVGRVVSGNIDRIILRKNSKVNVNIGEIIYFIKENILYLYQIYDIEHASVMDAKDIHLSAYNMDVYKDTNIYEKDQRHYDILYAKPLGMVDLNSRRYGYIKSLPPIFSEMYKIDKEVGRGIVEIVKDGIEIGVLRSGNDVIDVPIPFNIVEAVNHHILVAATTGRGKSNLLKVLIWKMMYSNNVGLLVMDPHDEYILPTKGSLMDHPRASENLVYFSYSEKKYDVIDSYKLYVDVSLLKPQHFLSVFNFSEPQIQAMYMVYQEAKERWIERLLKDENLKKKILDKGVRAETYDVLKRKIMFYLNISINEDANGNVVLGFNSVFRSQEGGSFINTVVEKLEEGRVVVLDTSELTSSEELLIMSVIAHYIFEKYKYYKKSNLLDSKAKIGIILEEAPRILNNSLLSNENNVFGTIAREGRKFNIGIIAVTQLPSLIPNEILSNMNTKIILGIEMQKERNIVINSSPQDLSKDDRIIASLNKGECIITSIFTPFPLPLKVHYFEDLVIKEKHNDYKESFSALKRGEDLDL